MQLRVHLVEVLGTRARVWVHDEAQHEWRQHRVDADPAPEAEGDEAPDESVDPLGALPVRKLALLRAPDPPAVSPAARGGGASECPPPPCPPY